MRIVTDMIEFCSKEVPPVETRYRSAATTFAKREHGGAGARLHDRRCSILVDVESCLQRGMDGMDDFCTAALVFLHDVHNDFFEEIAEIPGGTTPSGRGSQKERVRREEGRIDETSYPRADGRCVAHRTAAP